MCDKRMFNHNQYQLLKFSTPITYLGRDFVLARAWNFQLGILGLDLGTHAKSWLFFLVGQVHLVTAGSDLCEITIFTRLST